MITTIILGTLGGLALFFGLAWFVLARRERRRREQFQAEDTSIEEAQRLERLKAWRDKQ